MYVCCYTHIICGFVSKSTECGFVSKSTECTTLRVNHNVNYGL